MFLNGSEREGDQSSFVGSPEFQLKYFKIKKQKGKYYKQKKMMKDIWRILQAGKTTK